MPHPTRETVFRSDALRHDEQPEDESHRPRLDPPRGVIFPWLLLALCSGGGLAALAAFADRLVR